MKTIGNDAKQLGGGNTRQHARNTTSSSSTGGWKTPWWVFNFIKYVHSLSPMLGRVAGFLITIVTWLVNFAIAVLKAFSEGIIKGIIQMLWIALALGVTIVIGLQVINHNFSISGVEVTWHSIVIPPVIGLILLYVVLRIVKTRKEAAENEEKKDDEEVATPSTDNKTPTEKKVEKAATFYEAWWVKGRLLPILVCIILVHCAIYQLFPGFWWNNILTLKSFGLQLAIGIAISVKPQNEKKPGKYKLSTFATFMLLLTLMVSITIGNVEAGITKATTWFETNLSKVKALRTTPVTSTGEVTYPRDEHWPDKDVAEQILEGQWDLLATCNRESGLKQFGPDGKVLVYDKNRNGTVDTGICQINSVHDPELTRLGLDKNKLEDNLKFAKILYEKEGLKPWNIKSGQKLTFQVPVSDKGTNTFKRPQNVYTLFNNKESVHIALNNERWTTILEADPGFTDFTPAGTIVDYKFALLPGKTENTWVTVTYTYQ